jgi:two-component system response regulator MprA
MVGEGNGVVPASSPRIQLLLIEDDPEVARTIRAGLDARRFALDHALTIADARRKLMMRAYGAVVLDLALPDGSGLELADALRAAGSDVPIIMLTARSRVDERVEGFAHGADDYLCKPFAVEELVARLNAVLGRARPERRHILKYGGIELDLLNRVVRGEDVEATLSDRETALLAYLMRHPEEPLARARLLEEVWRDDAGTESSVLNVYINYLRNKLERGQNPRVIHTVRGVGYMLSRTSPT